MQSKKSFIIGGLILLVVIIGATFAFVTFRNNQRVEQSMNEVASLDSRVLDPNPLLESEVITSGDFESAGFYRTSGGVSIRQSNDLTAVVLEDDFDFGSNAPDPVMYLCDEVRPDEVDDCIILGALENDQGSSAWEITMEESNQFDNVILWCRAFEVLMGTASLN